MKMYQEVDVLAGRLYWTSLEFVIIAVRGVIGEGIVGNISPIGKKVEWEAERKTLRLIVDRESVTTY